MLCLHQAFQTYIRNSAYVQKPHRKKHLSLCEMQTRPNTLQSPDEMILLNKISSLLSIDKVQRCCYLTALVIWIFISRNSIEFYNTKSSLGINYIWLIIIPGALLIVQIIFNRTLTWAIIWGLIGFYTIWTIFEMATIIIINEGREYVKSFNWEWKEILGMIFVLLILFLINWTVYNLRPNRRPKQHIA
jgi:hypothetical protein